LVTQARNLSGLSISVTFPLPVSLQTLPSIPEPLLKVAIDVTPFSSYPSGQPSPSAMSPLVIASLKSNQIKSLGVFQAMSPFPGVSYLCIPPVPLCLACFSSQQSSTWTSCSCSLVMSSHLAPPFAEVQKQPVPYWKSLEGFV
jgi:hypothetical protein